MKLMFSDQKSGTALYQAELPEGFTPEAVYTPRRFQLSEGFVIRGTAAKEGEPYRLYFRTGENYSWSDRGSGFPEGARNEEGVIIHEPCDAALQLDEFAAEFTGQYAEALQYFNLTDRKCQLLQPEQEQEIQDMYRTAMQAASISPMPMNVQVQDTVNDGGTGMYTVETKQGRKTLLVTLWRRGLLIQVMPQGLNLSGIYAQMARPLTLISWGIPLVTYMLSDREPDRELIAVYNSFYESLSMTPEFEAYAKALAQQNQQKALQAAAMQSRETQAQISLMWQQHEAGWAKADRMRQSLSQDLDAFRAHQSRMMSDYDRLHAPGGALYSTGAPSMDYIGAGESTDDRIRRLRHESMMGVNTYTDADGREVEFSTEADRVFQNSLDNGLHVGTEHYYDDYVPEGWSELFRKY